MENISSAIHSKLPSWQMDGGGGGVLGNPTQSSQKSCPNNWQNSVVWKSLSWSLKVHVMKLTREMLKVTMLPLLKQKKNLDSKILMTGCASHQKASLQTLSLVWVRDFAKWRKYLRNFTTAKVLEKLSSKESLWSRVKFYADMVAHSSQIPIPLSHFVFSVSIAAQQGKTQ